MPQTLRHYAIIFSILLLSASVLADDMKECARHILVDGNYRNAFPFCKLAAEQGDTIAQSALGDMYYEGKGVPQDQHEAVKWYRLAAEQGDASAQYDLGWMYYNGEGVPQDQREAAKWYHLAAEQGHANAQYNLGLMYYKGEGVLQDYKEAYIWLSLGAITGHERAVKGRELVEPLLTKSEIESALQEAKHRLAEIDSRKNQR